MKTAQNNKKQTEFRNFLRKIAHKGFYEILLYIEAHPNSNYTKITKYVMDKKILKSGASITILVNTFTKNGILQRKVTDQRPIRVVYSITSDGHKVIKLLKNLEKLLK